MKFEINISDDDWKLMLKNRYGHGDVVTRSYMLDIVHDIIDQMHEHQQKGVYKALGGALQRQLLYRGLRWYIMSKVIHTGTDARGNTYKLVRTANGGCKYIWDAGHCWADFTPAHRKAYIDTMDGIL